MNVERGYVPEKECTDAKNDNECNGENKLKKQKKKITGKLKKVRVCAKRECRVDSHVTTASVSRTPPLVSFFASSRRKLTQLGAAQPSPLLPLYSCASASTIGQRLAADQLYRPHGRLVDDCMALSYRGQGGAWRR